MSQRLTPPIGLSGTYQVSAPFTLRSGVQYTCHAQRSFDDLATLEINVFEAFYEPHGLSYQVYKNDRANGALIVTLKSNEHVVYVPDTYIEALPDRTTEAMSLVVLSADLGPLPDSLGVSHVEQAFGDYCSDILGYRPEVQLLRLEHTGELSQEEIDNINTAREAALTIRKDVWTQLRESEQKNQRLQDQLEAMEQLLLDNDLVTPTP